MLTNNIKTIADINTGAGFAISALETVPGFFRLTKWII